jgi:hypothetical protein
MDVSVPRGRPKGSPRVPGSGRKPGGQNKTTAEVKAVMTAFVTETMHEVLVLWREIATSANNADKARAVELWARIANLVCPKATEVSGADGGPVVVEIVKYQEGA